LRQYLLDRLPEAEGHRIEELAFEDDQFEQRLLDAEYDLLDDFGRGSLSAGDRKAVQQRYPSERLNAGARFSTRSAQPKRRARNWWPIAAAAAALVLVIPAVYLQRDRAHSAPQPDVSIATLSLRAQTAREAAPIFTVSPKASLGPHRDRCGTRIRFLHHKNRIG
jgi:hypothetical protein